MVPWWTAIVGLTILAIVGMGFYFEIFLIWVCLRSDVGWLNLFGFEEDGWVVMGGAAVDGNCGSHYSCYCGYGILF